jgi:hypothetical protein
MRPWAALAGSAPWLVAGSPSDGTSMVEPAGGLATPQSTIPKAVGASTAFDATRWSVVASRTKVVQHETKLVQQETSLIQGETSFV